MGVKVCKFGGTSLADANQFRKVQAIVQSDPERRYVVPSAPGKRAAEDRKITDLLYLCHAHMRQRVSADEVFNLIAGRYLDIARYNIGDLVATRELYRRWHECLDFQLPKSLSQ